MGIDTGIGGTPAFTATGAKRAVRPPLLIDDLIAPAPPRKVERPMQKPVPEGAAPAPKKEAPLERPVQKPVPEGEGGAPAPKPKRPVTGATAVGGMSGDPKVRTNPGAVGGAAGGPREGASSSTAKSTATSGRRAPGVDHQVVGVVAMPLPKRGDAVRSAIRITSPVSKHGTQADAVEAASELARSTGEDAAVTVRNVPADPAGDNVPTTRYFVAPTVRDVTVGPRSWVASSPTQGGDHAIVALVEADGDVHERTSPMGRAIARLANQQMRHAGLWSGQQQLRDATETDDRPSGTLDAASLEQLDQAMERLAQASRLMAELNDQRGEQELRTRAIWGR